MVVPGRGVCADLPTVIALRGSKVVAVGDEAVQMEDRCPSDVDVIRPLMDARVHDHRATELFISGLLRQSLGRTSRRPHILLSVSPNLSEVERAVLVGRLHAAGAGEVWPVHSPLLSALGVGLDVHSVQGHLLGDLGAGQSSFSCLALGRIVHHTTTLAAGDQITSDIQQHVAHIRGLSVTRNTAQILKHHLIDVSDRTARTQRIAGKDARTQHTREDDVSATELASGTRQAVLEIRQTVRDLLSRLSPQLCDDVLDRGLILTGGGARLGGLLDVLRTDIELPVLESPEPAMSIALGLAQALEDSEVRTWLAEAQ